MFYRRLQGVPDSAPLYDDKLAMDKPFYFQYFQLLSVFKKYVKAVDSTFFLFRMRDVISIAIPTEEVEAKSGEQRTSSRKC